MSDDQRGVAAVFEETASGEYRIRRARSDSERRAAHWIWPDEWEEMISAQRRHDQLQQQIRNMISGREERERVVSSATYRAGREWVEANSRRVAEMIARGEAQP